LCRPTVGLDERGEAAVARIVKEHAARRNEILDAAQQLVYTEGYGQMTIQDILDDLRISKGAFYHYFDSKQALLEALIHRMIDDAMQVIVPILQDPHLGALEKLQRYFDTAARWKTDRKTYLLALLRVWYTDDNAIVRQKQVAAAVERVTPLIAEIIRQGIQEGVFSTPYPDQVSGAIMSLMQGLGDAIILIFLSQSASPDDLQRIEAVAAAYTDAMERVLGASTGSLHLVDTGILKEWLVAAREHPLDLGERSQKETSERQGYSRAFLPRGAGNAERSAE
jgi:AcrR family transcriptional regulator